MLIALLRRGTPAALGRARVLGDSLVYVMDHENPADGRIGASYGPAPLTSPGATTPTSPASTVGNMSWVGMALLQLSRAGGGTQYRAAALRSATWIQSNAFGAQGIPGYTGGQSATGARLTYKSTENNIDVDAFFSMLTTVTGQSVWSTRAGVAAAFVRSMRNRAGYLAVGTSPDGATLNTAGIAEDTQSWSYLVRPDAFASSSLDWAATHLSVVDPPYRGVGFSNSARSRVWFEGTAHLAAALYRRDGPGDRSAADAYLAAIRLAQVNAPNNDRQGIVAASATASTPVSATPSTPPCTPARPPGTCSRPSMPTRSSCPDDQRTPVTSAARPGSRPGSRAGARARAG